MNVTVSISNLLEDIEEVMQKHGVPEELHAMQLTRVLTEMLAVNNNESPVIFSERSLGVDSYESCKSRINPEFDYPPLEDLPRESVCSRK